MFCLEKNVTLASIVFMKCWNSHEASATASDMTECRASHHSVCCMPVRLPAYQSQLAVVVLNVVFFVLVLVLVFCVTFVVVVAGVKMKLCHVNHGLVSEAH